MKCALTYTLTRLRRWTALLQLRTVFDYCGISSGQGLAKLLRFHFRRAGSSSRCHRCLSRTWSFTYFSTARYCLDLVADGAETNRPCTQAAFVETSRCHRVDSSPFPPRSRQSFGALSCAGQSRGLAIQAVWFRIRACLRASIVQPADLSPCLPRLLLLNQDHRHPVSFPRYSKTHTDTPSLRYRLWTEPTLQLYRRCCLRLPSQSNLNFDGGSDRQSKSFRDFVMSCWLHLYSAAIQFFRRPHLFFARASESFHLKWTRLSLESGKVSRTLKTCSSFWPISILNLIYQQ